MLDSYLTSDATKDHLIAARMATLLHLAVSGAAVAFRDEVLEVLYDAKAAGADASGKRGRKVQAKEAIAHQQTLDALLADLVRFSVRDEALGYCYRSSNRQSFTDSATRASSRVFDWQLLALTRAGLIQHVPGFTAKDDFDGVQYELFRRAARLRATPALLAIAQRHGITADNLQEHYTKLKERNLALIVLKRNKKTYGQSKMLPCPDTEEVSLLRTEVERINAIFGGHRFDGLPEPQVYRLFNCADADGFAYNKGGRLYGDFQGVVSEKRRYAQIDGRPVVELDLKASQLTILYGVTQTPMQEGDPYLIEGLPRPVVKAIVTVMLGLGHPNLTKWPEKAAKSVVEALGGAEGMNGKTLSKLYPIKATAQKVLKRHPVLHHLSPGRMDWADLSFIESQVLISTILHLGEMHDIPALPVHDSIIVPRDAEQLARTVMTDMFVAQTGREPQIKAK